MTDHHRHELTFSAKLPLGASAQAKILAHPKIEPAIKALEKAFDEAGCPHEMTDKIVKPGRGGARKKPIATASAEEAAE